MNWALSRAHFSALKEKLSTPVLTILHAELNNREKGRKNKHSTWFCDVEGLNLKLHFKIIKSLLPWGDTSTGCSVPLKQRYSFHLDMIAQLLVYHAWHWRNVPFSESPHKTLIYKSLAEISPLAKLPSQAVDFQMPYLQSAAQRGPSRWGITRVGEEASAGSGCLAESVSAVTHRSFHSYLHFWHQARISATFKTGEPATASPFRTSLRDEGSLIRPLQPGINIRMPLGIHFGFWFLPVVEVVGEL